MEEENSHQNRPDPNLAGRFYLHPVKCAEDGSVREELFIEVRAKGMTNSTKSWRIHEGNKKQIIIRFPRAWAEFNQSGVVPVDGTPIKMLPMVTEYLADEFRKLDVLTVEDLAQLPDSALINFRDGFRLRNAARGYLKAIKDFNNEPVPAIQNSEESEELIDEPLKKKRGRPFKAAE